jgi:IclR family acetate operon transcriptional repressor
VNSTARYEIRSVTRALDVLIALSEPGKSDLSSIARRTELHPTTTLRLLESLRARGFARNRGGSWEVGPRAFEVGSVFLSNASIEHEAQRLVEALAERMGETANLGILVDGEVLYLAIARAQRELGILATAGGRHPAYCTALGKMMLAQLPWDQVEAILAEHPPVRLTASTLVDREDIRRDLERVARRGYAVDAEERTPGVVCLAAPIRDFTGGVVAAISISGPRLRMPGRRLPALAREVIAVADEASQVLGAPATPHHLRG